MEEVKMHGSVVIAYLFGAPLSGPLIAHRVAAVMLLRLAGVSAALMVHRIANPATTRR